jgi:hypothetical protein
LINLQNLILSYIYVKVVFTSWEDSDFGFETKLNAILLKNWGWTLCQGIQRVAHKVHHYGSGRRSAYVIE